jgi:phosphoribosylglycinamide formyltransferase-1
MRVAVLFSGRGTNLKAIIEMAKLHPDVVDVVCAITDNINSIGIRHAWDNFIPVSILSKPVVKDKYRNQWERNITSILCSYNVDLVVLAGFMQILHEDFCGWWKGRCINIHPSLLPKYPGLNTHKRVLGAGDEWHGCTVHYVTPDVDGGPIIAQDYVKVETDDTEESLAARVLERENILLPKVVYELCRYN